MISQPNHSVKRKSLVIGSKYKTRLFLFIFVFLLPNYYLLVFLVTIVILRSQNYNSKLKIKKPREQNLFASAWAMGFEITYRELKLFSLPEDNYR